MFKTMSVSLLAITLLGSAAQAVQCPTFPNPLTNGTTADANAVMNDLQYLQDCPALGTNPSFTGNVGIGTVSPIQTLDVTNAGYIQGLFRSISSGYGGGIQLWGYNGSSYQQFELQSIPSNGTPASSLIIYDRTHNIYDLTINPSGNIGIGTTSPEATLQVNGSAVIGSSAGGAAHVVLNGGGILNTKEMLMFYASGSPSSSATDYGVLQAVYQDNYYTNLSLNPSGGNVGIGTTTPAEALDTGTGFVRANGFIGRPGIGGTTSHVFNINWTGSAAQLWIDYTNVGTISTVSDRRLKQQIATEPDTGLSRIMQLRPVTFHWRNADIFHDDGIQHEGFIADELQTVIPSAVVNNKDQVDANGKPVYQSIIPSEIIPVLTKALQEQQAAIQNQLAAIQNQQTTMQAQQAEIDSLKSQIAALQAAR